MLIQPHVLCREIDFVDWALCSGRNGFGICRHGAPEVRDEAVCIIYHFVAVDIRPVEQYCARSEERLNVGIDLSEVLPHIRGHSTLSAEPREGCLQLRL